MVCEETPQIRRKGRAQPTPATEVGPDGIFRASSGTGCIAVAGICLLNYGAFYDVFVFFTTKTRRNCFARSAAAMDSGAWQASSSAIAKKGSST